MEKNQNEQLAVIRVGGFIENSCADGPGIRSVLFFQGCNHGCEGCHNPDLHPAKGGKLFTVAELYEFICQKCRNKKLTISGGEPLEQYDELLCLIQTLAKDDFDLCLYTGYSDHKCIPDAIIRHLKYLKTGPYISELRISGRYYGSTNQKFYKINYKDGDLCTKEI